MLHLTKLSKVEYSYALFNKIPREKLTWNDESLYKALDLEIPRGTD